MLGRQCLVVLVLGCTVALGACSTKGEASRFWYGIGQDVQKGQCSELREPERRDTCYKAASKSYEEYEKQRKQK